MNMKKILALLLAAVLLVGVLSACGNGEANAPSASEEPAAEAGTRTVKDVLGREVEIASDIQTVACPGLPSTRMVVYAGAVDKIAGVTENEKMELACAPCSDVFHDKFFGRTPRSIRRSSLHSIRMRSFSSPTRQHRRMSCRSRPASPCLRSLPRTLWIRTLWIR